MTTQLSIKKNFIMNLLLTISRFIFPLITFQYASHILLPDGIGKVTFATSFVSYFLLISQMGIPMYGVRCCAVVRNDEKALARTVQELLIINLIMAGVSYILLFGAVAVLPNLRNEKLLYVVISSQIVLDAIGVEWLYKAKEQYTYIALRSVAFKVIALVGLFFLLHSKDDYVIYAGIVVFASSAFGIMNFINAQRYITMKGVRPYQFKRHIKPILVFLAMAGATTIYTHLDSVMLGIMKTDADVGLYSVAVRIRGVLTSVVTALGVVLLPRASYYIKNGMMEDFRAISKKAVNFVWVLALPITCYFTIFAKESVLFLSGEAFIGAVIPMQVIMPTVLFVGITNVLGIQMLVPLGKERVVLLSEILGAVTDLILNAILIPSYASTGAAIGTLIAEIVVFIVQFRALKEFVYEAFSKIQYWKLIAGVIAGVCASFWTSAMRYSSFMTLLLSAMLFFTTYGIVLLLLKERLTTQVVRQVSNKVNAIVKVLKARREKENNNE